MNSKLIGADPASGKDETIYGFTNWPGGMTIEYPNLSVDLYIDKDWDKFLDKEESNTSNEVEDIHTIALRKLRELVDTYCIKETDIDTPIIVEAK